jgi:hypothetical protein
MIFFGLPARDTSPPSCRAGARRSLNNAAAARTPRRNVVHLYVNDEERDDGQKDWLKASHLSSGTTSEALYVCCSHAAHLIIFT